MQSSQQTDQQPEQEQQETSSHQTSISDQPPIITYPEFLTKPPRPPPLITPDNLLASLYAVGAVSTILYGTSRYIISPMVGTLTDARHELHASAAAKLTTMISKLEAAVSEVPGDIVKIAGGETGYGDDDSSAGDPTELFHRDFGTQTSASPQEPTPHLLSTLREETPLARQTRQLATIISSLAALRDDVVSQAEDLADVKTHAEALRDDVDALAYGRAGDFSTGTVSYSPYGGVRRSEPDDEIKRARDGIRRLKGALLSARNFPASTR